MDDKDLLVKKFFENKEEEDADEVSKRDVVRAALRAVTAGSLPGEVLEAYGITLSDVVRFKEEVTKRVKEYHEVIEMGVLPVHARDFLDLTHSEVDPVQ